MATDRLTLKAQPRTEFGSRESRRLRRAGFVPGIVYGGGAEARPFQVAEREVRNVLVHGGALIEVEIEGAGAVPAVIKEEQRDPVRGDLVHLDLQEVKLDVAIQADVAIELLGADDAPGVTEGGVLSQEGREVTVEALPNAVPDVIQVDVSHMVINDTLTVEAIAAPEGVTIIDDPETVIATITPPTLEPTGDEIETETELVGEDGETAEAKAEGATGDDVEPDADSSDEE